MYIYTLLLELRVVAANASCLGSAFSSQRGGDADAY